MRRFKKITSFTAVWLIVLCVAAIPAQALEPGDLLTPVGRTVAIELEAQGVLVAGLAEVETAQGSVRPAEAAGLQPGDQITGINGCAIADGDAFQAATAALDGSPVELTVQRGGQTIYLTVTPALGSDGNRYLGLWLRRGITGVGTVTFQDPASGLYGALGHGVCAGEGSALSPVSGGSISSATVSEVVPGRQGTPGELVGAPSGGRALGDICANTHGGIFGHAVPLGGGAALPAAAKEQVQLGPARILATVDSAGPQCFDVEITRITRSGDDLRQLSLQVTDRRLLSITGGIVQGMSGSPIIQNNKLVGAVTHVLVGDPARGYGILIETMLNMAVF